MERDYVRLAQLNLLQFAKIGTVRRSVDSPHAAGEWLHRIRFSRPLEYLRQKRRHPSGFIFLFQLFFRITSGVIGAGLSFHTSQARMRLSFAKAPITPCT